MNIELPGWLKQDSPVFVVSPTARCGVTLIQRLLNSSGKIVVFGENDYFMNKLTFGLSDTLGAHSSGAAQFAEVRRVFKEETSDFWSSNLWPDTAELLLAVIEHFVKMAHVFRGNAAKLGRNRWGIKQPLETWETVKILSIFIPNARFVFIYRNLMDAAKSAKTRKWMTDEASFREMAQRWSTNMNSAFGSGDGRVLKIRYEALVSDPESVITSLEKHCSLNRVDRSVMDRKFNTFVGENRNGYSKDMYINPENLSATESQILIETAGPAMEKYGYRF